MAEYDASTALLVVDMQNDFADPAGGLYVRGGEELLPLANREIRRATEAGAVVVYTQDWHPPDTPHFAKDGGVWPVHCLADSWGAQFHPSLRIVDGADVVRKGQGGEDGYSAFSVREPTTGEHADTGLEEILRARGVRNVVIVGLATDYCVKETGLDAIRLGFGATVVTDAIGAVDLNPGDGTRALETIRAAGVKLA